MDSPAIGALGIETARLALRDDRGDLDDRNDLFEPRTVCGRVAGFRILLFDTMFPFPPLLDDAVVEDIYDGRSLLRFFLLLAVRLVSPSRVSASARS